MRIERSSCGDDIKFSELITQANPNDGEKEEQIH